MPTTDGATDAFERGFYAAKDDRWRSTTGPRPIYDPDTGEYLGSVAAPAAGAAGRAEVYRILEQCRLEGRVFLSPAEMKRVDQAFGRPPDPVAQVREIAHQQMAERRAKVSLDNARRLVGETMHVDREWWAWTPGEIRWLAEEWRRATAEVEVGHPPGAERVDTDVWAYFVPLAGLAVTFLVFAVGFCVGWLG